ncbi:DUF4465 domain-containing protein, partial [Bacteroides faecis]
FCGCSDDDKDNGPKTYVLNLPSYETHTLDLGDVENPIDTWSSSYEDQGTTYTTNYFQTLLTDNSKIFEFDCISSDSYGFGSDGFAFTNCTINDCPDFSVYDYRAIPKKGVSSNTYVVVGAAGYKVGSNSDKEVSIRFKDNENPNKTEDYQVKGLYVTNCVYAYKSMKEGSSIFSGLDKFEANDSFKLKIHNFDKTKMVECDLAEGTNILTTWKWVDLTALGETNGLKFTMISTKVNDWGPMTPTYFCLDGITLIED